MLSHKALVRPALSSYQHSTRFRLFSLYSIQSIARTREDGLKDLWGPKGLRGEEHSYRR